MMQRALLIFCLSLSACWAQQGEPTAFPEVPVNPNNPTTPTTTGRFHPDSWAAPTEHGLAAKLNRLDCRGCHGQDLSGGSALSCDSCHRRGWRTNCTFCHGGTLDTSGAPPRDIRGEVDPMLNSFRAHQQHVSERNHEPFDCSECHQKPTDVTSIGHLFDNTPGKAEVDFTGGRSPQGQYEGEGRCSNLYCHSNGRGTLGGYSHDQPRPTCNTCHDVANSGSGAHRKHLAENIACEECHGATARGTMEIINPANHVNGVVNIQLVQQMSRSAETCTGTCHGELHQSRGWNDDDD